MSHSETQFESANLRMRKFTLGDASVVYRLSQEAGLRRFIPDQVYKDVAEAADVLRFLIAQYDELEAARSGTYVLAVELKESGNLIGHVGLSPATIGPAAGAMEIGYAIAEAWRGRGYATQLVTEAVRWALQTQRLPHVLGIVDRKNVGSTRVLEKAGFTLTDETPGTLHGRPAVVRTYRATVESIALHRPT